MPYDDPKGQASPRAPRREGPPRVAARGMTFTPVRTGIKRNPRLPDRSKKEEASG